MEYLGRNKLINNSMPLVSVCVQTYQHARYIRKCLNGILCQETSFPFEIIIGEDESSDGTREICKEYATKFPEKIRLILRGRKDVIYINGKATGRFNLIENLKLARGKYIALCEGDDYWLDPKKLQKQVDFLENNEGFSGVYSNFMSCDINGRIINRRCLNSDQPAYFDKISILKSGLPMTLTVMYRNIPEAIDQMAQLNVVNGDQLLSACMAQHGKIKYLDFISAVYRRGSGTFSSRKHEDKMLASIETFSQLKTIFTDDLSIDALNLRIENIYRSYIYHLIIRGNVKKAIRFNVIRKSDVHTNSNGMLNGFLKYVKNAIKVRVRKFLPSFLAA